MKISRTLMVVLMAAMVIMAGTIVAYAMMPPVPDNIPMNDNAKDNAKFPDNAAVGKDGSGSVTVTPPVPEKVVFIHYKDGHVKPVGAGVGKPPKDTYTTYSLMGKGIKWKSLPINIVIDTSTLPGNFALDDCVSAVDNSMGEWDRYNAADLFGGYNLESGASWDGDAGDRPDGRNEFVFGDYNEHGVIAITVTWGYFGGPIGSRSIIEFDVLFNTYYTWGVASANATVMDLQNIATHEIGHGLGLNDLYGSSATLETMYGYSDYNEIIKRDLHDGDIAGIHALYGL